MICFDSHERLGAFIEIHEQIDSDREYFRLLGDIIVHVDDPWQWMEEILWLLDETDRNAKKRKYLMNFGERIYFHQLPEIFDVYRGCRKSTGKGLV